MKDDRPDVRVLPIEREAPRARALCLANVAPEPIRWLWEPRLALGKVSLIVGDPGLNKSTLTLDAAARVSTGSAWPDGRPSPAGAVVILSAEDDAADTIRPRLDAAGGDPSNIYLLESVRQPDGEQTVERTFSLLADVEVLAELIQDVEARLAIIDPLSAYLGRTDSHNNADVRAALTPLQRMASETRCAVVAVSHLNKSSGQSALYRTTGSLAFTAAARAVYAVTRDQADPERRLLVPVKNNIGEDRSGLAYRVVTATNNAPRIEWEPEPIEISADDALALPDEARTERDEAADWLRSLLERGPQDVTELKREAECAGFAWRTVRRAKNRIGAVSEKAAFSGGWRWAIPDGATKAARPPSPNLAPFADGDDEGGHTPNMLATFDESKRESGVEREEEPQGGQPQVYGGRLAPLDAEDESEAAEAYRRRSRGE